MSHVRMQVPSSDRVDNKSLLHEDSSTQSESKGSGLTVKLGHKRPSSLPTILSWRTIPLAVWHNLAPVFADVQMHTRRRGISSCNQRRWRPIILAAGLIALCTLLLWDATSSTFPKTKPEAADAPPMKSIVKVLSPEEEAMFGQYQAVGLGNDTLEEAYAPVPRTYVPPPNGDIYSTFGIVIASFGPHAAMLARFLDSMVKFCLDCHRVRILLIIPAKEVDLFNSIRAQFIEDLPSIEVVPFSHVFPALNATLAANTPGWPEGWIGWDEERLLRLKDRAVFQSFKKLYGCLYLATEYCMLLDSEGFFIRQATLADIYGGTRKSPYVIYASHVRQTWPYTQTAKALLGYHENWGWALEEYNWSLDNNILAEIERIFHRARPTLDAMESLVFIEVVYWIYMMHNRHRYPSLRVIDSVNLFGIDAYNNMRKFVNFDDHAFTPWEDLRWYMEKDPSLITLGVELYNKHNFKMFKTSWNKESRMLLEQAHSIVLCVSEQPGNMYDLAMTGHFNKTSKG